MKKRITLVSLLLLGLSVAVFASPYGEKSRPTNVGDIVFADGTATAWHKGLTLTQEQKKATVAVIFYAGNTGDALGKKMLGVGLRHATGRENALSWARFTSNTDKAEGYDAKIEGILCLPNRNSSAENATFIGDTDGKNNWAVLCDAVNDEGKTGNYPAWEWVNAYASSASLTGECANGWYLPTVAELCMLYRAKDTVNAALDCAGGMKITDTGDCAAYWSSSQSPYNNNSAWSVWFEEDFIIKSGDLGAGEKHGEYSVCAIRNFSEENAAVNDRKSPEQIAAEVQAFISEENRLENEMRAKREQEWKAEKYREHKTFIEQGLSLISFMREKADNDVYAQLLGMSEEVIAKIHPLRTFNVSKISSIARLSGVYGIYGLDENLTQQLSPALKREIEILLLKSFSGNWNKNADKDEIEAANVIAAEKTFVCTELKEDCIYIFRFDDCKYPVTVSFVRGEGNSVTAFACFVLDEQFTSYVWREAAMGKSGLKWEWIQ